MITSSMRLSPDRHLPSARRFAREFAERSARMNDGAMVRQRASFRSTPINEAPSARPSTLYPKPCSIDYPSATIEVRGDFRQLAATLNIPLKRQPGRLRSGHFFLSDESMSQPSTSQFRPIRRMPASRALTSAPWRIACWSYDGAMGTNIQLHHPTAEDFGGKSLEGCNDHLVLTRPDIIQSHPRVVSRGRMRRRGDVHLPVDAAPPARVGASRRRRAS